MGMEDQRQRGKRWKRLHKLGELQGEGLQGPVLLTCLGSEGSSPVRLPRGPHRAPAE